MFKISSCSVLLAFLSVSESTPVKPFSDYIPNQHCPSWQLFNNECLDRYYEVSCYCDAECNGKTCADSPRLDDKEYNPPDTKYGLLNNTGDNNPYRQDNDTTKEYGVLVENGGNLISNNSICCRNPFTCKQECTQLLLHEACPTPPDGWTTSSCPDGIITSGCSDDKDCVNNHICCLRHDECAYGCIHTTRTVDPWY